MNDSFESDERKRKEIIECLYWSLMNGWDIPKEIREHYGFSEDYELYHRLESMAVNITDFQRTMNCTTGLKVWNRKITGKEGSEARFLMPWRSM